MGKSTFGHWLADTHDFIHVDLVKQMGQIFDYQLRTQRVVVDTCPAAGKDLVATLATYRQLINDYGFEDWWFDGDRDAARQGTT